MKVKRFLPILAAAMLMLTGCARSDAKTAYEKGCSALKSGNLEDALNFFNGVVETEYYLPQAYRGLGLTYLSESDYADACISFEKALNAVDSESDEFIRDVNLYLAYARELKGETDAAMDIYNNLIMKSPDAEVLFLRGKLNLRQDNNDEAKSDFDRAVSISSDYNLFINIYQVYDEEDKSGDGAVYLEKALDEAMKKEDAFYEQGLVNYYLGNYDASKEELTSAIKADASDTKAIFLLGKVYLATNDIANARSVYNQYTDVDGVSATAYNGLALCDMAEGNYEDALAKVQQGLALDSSNESLMYNEIVIYEQMRDWENAKSRASAYVAKFPTDEAGLREYSFLMTR